MEPLEITETGTMASLAPRRKMEPLPNCFSIWPRVNVNVRMRSFSSMGILSRIDGGGSTSYYSVKQKLAKLFHGSGIVSQASRSGVSTARVVAFAGAYDQV